MLGKYAERQGCDRSKSSFRLRSDPLAREHDEYFLGRKAIRQKGGGDIVKRKEDAKNLYRGEKVLS